jgi:type IV pilus assembly protein PilC
MEMGLFNYECLTKQGDAVKGQINADHLSAALARLKSMDLMIVDLREVHTSSINSFLSNEKKVKTSDLTMFSRQLSAMLKAGIPITRALHTLSRQTGNPTFRNALENISRNVEGGMNLTEAFSAYPKIFSDLFISMIRAGELGGILDDSLLRLSDQLQKDKTLQDNIRAATFYPRMVLGFAVLLLTGMLLFLVPVFQKYIPASAEIPAITAFIFAASYSLRNFWYIWLLVIIAIVAGFIAFTKSNSSKRIWDKIKFKLPAFGPLIHKSVIARFSRTLATLLEGGIPVVQALESAGPTSGSIILADVVTYACRKITEGKNISGPLEESDLFPPMFIHMVAVGEETGSLSSLLEKLAEFYEDEVETSSKGLTALIEPIMMISVGLVVGIMLISLYLPIFSSITMSGGG